MLGAYNDEIVLGALNCLRELAIPAPSHRCEHYLDRHITSLNKNPAYFAPIFEIIENSYLYSVKHLSKGDILPYKEQKDEIRLDSSSRLFMHKIEPDSSTEKRAVDTVFELSNFSNDERPLKQILWTDASGLTYEQKFSLIWQMRSKRNLNFVNGRNQILNCLYQATSILLSCHPDSNLLMKFFMNKCEFVKDFIFLISTGPGSVNYTYENDDFELRALACYCLSAFLETKDSMGPSVFTQYPWLLNDLGVNRGQYMGLLPRLLHSSAASIVEIKSRLQEDPGYVITKEETRRVYWMECILILFAVVVNANLALPALVDNGLVSSIISLVKIDPVPCSEDCVLFMEALSMEVLESALSQSNPSLQIFREILGLNIIVDRLSWQLKHIIEKRNEVLLPTDNIMIQVLISVVSTLLQEGRIDIVENGQSQLHRIPNFIECLQIIFKHADYLSPTIVSATIALLVDIINRDPAPPTILTAILGANITADALSVVRKSTSPFVLDIPLNELSLASSLSITETGINAVLASDLFDSLFAMFHNEKYFLPHSRTMMAEIPTNMGAGLEELVRHYPTYLKPCMNALFKHMDEVCTRVEASLGANVVNANFTKIGIDDEIILGINLCVAFISCLEPLLLKKQVVDYFLERRGFEYLVRFWNISLGTPRFLLLSIACMTDSTVHSIGFAPLEALVSRCIQQIATIDSSALTSVVIKIIDQHYHQLQDQLEGYNSTFGPRQNSRKNSIQFFLDTVTRQPLYKYTELGALPPNLVAFTEVMRSFALLNHLCAAFGTTLSLKNVKKDETSSIDSLDIQSTKEVIDRLVNQLFIPIEFEMARARGSITPTKIDETLVQPLYYLLVVSDNAIVRDGFEEAGKRVAKYTKGSKLVAYERMYNSANVLKYRTDEGWVSVFRNSSSNDPQIIVYEIVEKSEEVQKQDIILNSQKFVATQKRFEFEKISNVTARRGGFFAFYLFHFTIKTSIIGPIAKLLYGKDQSISLQNPENTIQIKSFTADYLTMIISSLSKMLPIVEASPKVNFSGNQASASLFPSYKIPTFDNCGTEKIYITIRVLEICGSILFERHRSKGPDMNYLVFINLLGNVEFLENLLQSTVNIFLCSLNAFVGSAVIDYTTLLGNYPAEWNMLSDVELEDKTAENDEMLKVYQGIRLNLKERKMLAISSLENMIEFWKQVLTSLGSHTNSIEKAFEKFGDEDHDYHPELFKRKCILLISLHLSSIWNSKLIETLPPSIVKGIFDLMLSIAKSLQAAKAFNAQSQLTLPSTRMMGLGAAHRMLGGPADIFNDLPFPRNRQNRPAPFQIDQTSVQSLIDMGFDRASIERAIRSLHTNDVSQIVPFLLENPFLFHEQDVDPEVALPNDNTIDNSTANQPLQENMGAEEQKSAEVNARVIAPAPLPLIAKLSEEELKKEKSLLVRCLKEILESIPKTLISSLMEANVGMQGMLDPDVYNLNAQVTREAYSMMHLNQLLKFFEGYNLNEIAVKLILSNWLVDALLLQLEKVDPYQQIRGILYALLVLFTGKISASQFRQNGNNDLLLFHFRNDKRYQKAFERIVSLLSEVVESESIASQWVSCAVLLLDIFNQNAVIDIDNLRTSVKEIDSTMKIASSKVEEISGLMGLSREFLSEEIRGQIEKLKSESIQSVLGESYKWKPFVESPLSIDAKIDLIRICLVLIARHGHGVEVESNNNIVRAAMQMLIHLESDEKLRQRIQESRMFTGCLRTKTAIEGYASLVFTFFQRLFEDESYLKYSLKAAMSVIYERMTKKSNNSLSLKSFIEVACPLLYRNQDCFMSALEERFDFKLKLGEILLEPKKLIEADMIERPTPEKAPATMDSPSVATKKARVGLNAVQTTKSESSSFSARKRSLSSGDAEKVPQAIKTARIQLSNDVVTEICNQVMEKWLLVVTGDEVPTQIMGLSVTELFYVLADLNASIPAFATASSKLQVTNKGCLELMQKQEDNTGKKVDNNFVVFVLLCMVGANHEIRQRTESAKFKAILGADVWDAIFYFIAATISRPGDGRNIVLNEIIRVFDSEVLSQPNNNIVNTAIRYSEIIVSITSPPLKWSQRDSFVIPTKDITNIVISGSLLSKLVNFFSHIDVSHPSTKQVLMTLSKPIELLLKRMQTITMTADATKSIKKLSDVKTSETESEGLANRGARSSESIAFGEDLSSRRYAINHSYHEHLLLSNETQPMENEGDGEGGWGNDEENESISAVDSVQEEERVVDDDDDDDDEIDFEELDEEEQDLINQRGLVEDGDEDDNENIEGDRREHSDSDDDSEHHIMETHSDEDEDHSDHEHGHEGLDNSMMMEDVDHDDDEDEDIDDDDEDDDEEDDDDEMDDEEIDMDESGIMDDDESDENEDIQQRGENISDEELINAGDAQMEEDHGSGDEEDILEDMERDGDFVEAAGGDDDDMGVEVMEMGSPSRGSINNDDNDDADGMAAMMDRMARARRMTPREHGIGRRSDRHVNRLPPALGAADFLPEGLLDLLNSSAGGGGGGGGRRRGMIGGGAQVVPIGDRITFGDLQDLVSGVVQQGGTVTSSNARLDPRTGSITLSISRNRNNEVSTPGGVTSYSQPAAHPLIASGVERNRSRFSTTPTWLQPPSSIRQNPLSFMSLLDTRTEESQFTFDNHRSSRVLTSPKRRELGPLVSDRRWGVDIGEIESIGARISALSIRIENGLRRNLNLIESQQPQSDEVETSLKKRMRAIASHIFDSDDEETKEEGPLQETKESTEESHNSFIPSDMFPFLARTGNLTGRWAPQIPTPPPAFPQAAPPVPIITAISAEVPPVTSNSLPSVPISVENVQFVQSLPLDLRQEVLSAAEDDFLASLTPEMQEETRQLRRRNSMQEQPSTPVVPASVTVSSSLVLTTPVEINNSSSNSTASALVTQPKEEVAQMMGNVDQKESNDPAWFMKIKGGVQNCQFFSIKLVMRIYRWLLICGNDRVPASLLKILVTLCQYNSFRRYIVTGLFALLQQNMILLRKAMEEMCTIANVSSNGEEITYLHSELALLSKTTLMSSGSIDFSHFRKILATISVLLRKTDNLVWYDVLEQKAGETWLFANYLSLLQHVCKFSNIDLDNTLQVLEKLCSPLASVNSMQVNSLLSKLSNVGKLDAEDDVTGQKRVVPFPVLESRDAKTLTAVISQADTSSYGRKALMRIMRYLSLADSNWRMLLSELSTTTVDLIAKATMEFSNIYNALQEAVQDGENAMTVINRSEFSGNNILWEVRLLNVFRLMTVLRPRSGASAKDETLVISEHLRKINGNGLWDMLCDCLDLVREIEGIQDANINEMDTGATPAAKSDELKSSSALVTRFIPLMECFLMVYAKTLLGRPAETHTSSTTVVAGADSNTSSSNIGSELVRVNSVLPGSRFRQSPSYLLMQLEIADEVAANRLLRFVGRNHMLINMILRHNVHLLEGSFSPLVTVPKCRSMLHFDIKRAYFKSRLKKMKQSVSRASLHGSLRISVRRSHVFEDSFHNLRHKSADEMRKRLAVSFHGEEGMDAGGVTREWYAVLAREIFNANYALFISAGDNVTFQPNPQSNINHDHLSYFKFIGRVIGKAICDGHLLDAHFTRSFYKHILGLPVTINDLEAIEPEYYKSLTQILATPLDLLCLDMTFCAESNEFGVISTIDLIPNGRDIPVTDDNKQEYVRLIAHHRMTSAIRKQVRLTSHYVYGLIQFINSLYIVFLID